MASSPSTDTASEKVRNPRPHRRSTMPPEPKEGRLPDTISRDGWKLEISEDEVFEAANLHEKFKRGHIILNDLPKFDDPTQYGLSVDEEKKLLRLEIQRLIRDCTSKTPLIFKSENILGTLTPESFKTISNLADQIACNLMVISHDNQLVMMEHCLYSEQIAGAAVMFKAARTTLRKRYHSHENATPWLPQRIEPESDNRTVYFALVDHITSTVARVMLHLLSNKYWRNTNLAVLSRWSVKLKALSFDQTGYSKQALADGEALIEQIHTSRSEESYRIYKISNTTGKKDMEDDNGVQLHDESGPTQSYFLYNSLCRDNLHHIVYSSILSLHSNESFISEVSKFEVCSLIYETGLSCSLTALAADRHGDVTATSNSENIHYSYTVLKFLLDTVETMKTNQSPFKDHERAVIKWQWSEGRRKKQRVIERSFETSEADDIVSVLTLVSLADPYTTQKMATCMIGPLIYPEKDDPLIQFTRKHFQAKFVISTADFISERIKTGSRHRLYDDPEIVPVSGNVLNKHIRAGTNLMQYVSKDTPPSLEEPNTFEELQSVQPYLKDEKIMQNWIFTETSVIVKCRGYIAVIMGLCCILLGGAIAIPFTVKDRIVGVDPFQITTFAWLLVGVLLLVAKSRYVTQWPWHDFIHGRVICESVSDLADVTGVKSQTILQKLLHNEAKGILVTKGPYNGMFTRRAESAGQSGFSIDVPSQLSTLLASGFVILKVLSQDGEHLITLDVRKDTLYDYANHNGVGVSYLACLELGKRDEDDDIEGLMADPAPKVLYLSRRSLNYTRVLGLYIQDSSFG